MKQLPRLRFDGALAQCGPWYVRFCRVSLHDDDQDLNPLLAIYNIGREKMGRQVCSLGRIMHGWRSGVAAARFPFPANLWEIWFV